MTVLQAQGNTTKMDTPHLKEDNNTQHPSMQRPSCLLRFVGSSTLILIILTFPILFFGIFAALGMKVELFGVIMVPLAYAQLGLLNIRSLFISDDSKSGTDGSNDNEKNWHPRPTTAAVLAQIGLTLFYVAVASVPAAAHQFTKDIIWTTVGLLVAIVVNFSVAKLVYFASRRNAAAHNSNC
ncbi:hypothetical protein HDV05_006479 [Chytridiales sp. JEL 0842]|nr:hypothetical protein HDV05_006479 [Chytridiales sp. JEL 0842]